MEWGNNILFSHGTTSARGVCILIKKNCKVTIQDKTKYIDESGRVAPCVIQYENQEITICNVYAPNKDSLQFFVSLLDNAVQSNKVVIMGDLNLVLDTDMDRCGVKCNNNKAKEILIEEMAELMLTDVWRDRNEGVFRASFQKRKPYAASRIDNTIVSVGLSSQIASVFYIPGLMSDHSAMFISININEPIRGRGYWKINDSHIILPEFVAGMNQKLSDSLHEYSHLKGKEKWELLKFDAANFAQNFALQQACEKRIIINQLYEKIMEMEESLSEQYEERIYDLMNRSKEDLNELEKDRARGIMFRSKARWQVEAERNTSYFYNLE